MIYLDNAATTKVPEEVFDAMKPYFCEQYANPSAIYSFAGKGMKAVDEARRAVADFIGAQQNEIYFTAGGSESDNWAIKSAAEACKDKGKHIITSAQKYCFSVFYKSNLTISDPLFQLILTSTHYTN